MGKLGKWKYPHKTSETELIRSSIKDCSIEFSAKKTICITCDFFEYCKFKNRKKTIPGR